MSLCTEFVKDRWQACRFGPVARSTVWNSAPSTWQHSFLFLPSVVVTASAGLLMVLKDFEMQRRRRKASRCERKVRRCGQVASRRSTEQQQQQEGSAGEVELPLSSKKQKQKQKQKENPAFRCSARKGFLLPKNITLLGFDEIGVRFSCLQPFSDAGSGSPLTTALLGIVSPQMALMALQNVQMGYQTRRGRLEDHILYALQTEQSIYDPFVWSSLFPQTHKLLLQISRLPLLLQTLRTTQMTNNIPCLSKVDFLQLITHLGLHVLDHTTHIGHVRDKVGQSIVGFRLTCQTAGNLDCADFGGRRCQFGGIFFALVATDEAEHNG